MTVTANTMNNEIITGTPTVKFLSNDDHAISVHVNADRTTMHRPVKIPQDSPDSATTSIFQYQKYYMLKQN